MLDVLEARPEAQIVAGAYAQYNSLQAKVEVNDYSLLFEPGRAGEWRAYEAPPAKPGACHRVHAAHNFFMARRDTLRRHQWHDKMAIFEHEHFFFQLYLSEQVLVATIESADLTSQLDSIRRTFPISPSRSARISSPVADHLLVPAHFRVPLSSGEFT